MAARGRGVTAIPVTTLGVTATLCPRGATAEPRCSSPAPQPRDPHPEHGIPLWISIGCPGGGLPIAPHPHSPLHRQLGTADGHGSAFVKTRHGCNPLGP